MTEPLRIAFIGLGVMGGPMAGHLAAAGHHVVAYNRTQSRAQAWLEEQRDGGHDCAIADTPGQAAEDCDMAMICVGNDDDLAAVLDGKDGVLSALTPGAMLIDHTTVSAKMARQVYDSAKTAGISALDAPVSGGQAGAQKGSLAIMCGGTAEAFARAQPIMQAYGANIVHVGGPGAGQTAKMANQMCIAGTLAGLGEAVRLVQASDIDADKVLQAISGGAAQSWQMDNRWNTMVADEFDFGFAIDWMRKDLGYALDEARRLGLESPTTRMVDGFYAELQDMDGARQDTSALIRRLPKGRTIS
ncbi:MAG: NAD(P)-dependent oxidoreductase [Pontixanthobacter sp.]